MERLLVDGGRASDWRDPRRCRVEGGHRELWLIISEVMAGLFDVTVVEHFGSKVQGRKRVFCVDWGVLQ